MAVWLPRYRLNCQKCTKGQKRYRGCEVKAEQPFLLEIDGKKEDIQRCPVKLITPESLRIIYYFKFYQKGFLPSAGSISQQSSKLLDGFDIIENELERMKQKDAPRNK